MFFTQINNIFNLKKFTLKQCILAHIIVIVVILIIIWFWPVKKTLADGVSVSDYAHDGKVVILCEEAEGNTGPYWHIIKSSKGLDKVEVREIDIIGYTPDKMLKNSLYIYFKSKFLFVGEFSGHGDERVFDAEEWYFVGTIKRAGLLMPYPSKAINFFEISMLIFQDAT